MEDYGIRGVHLALQMLEGYDLLVLIDAIAGTEPPGTVTVLEVDPVPDAAEPLDAHRMDPQSVLRLLAEMGGEVGRGPRRRLPAGQPRRGDRAHAGSGRRRRRGRAGGRRPHRRKERPMLRRLVLLVSLVGAAVAVAREVVPEVRRYLKIREM